MGEIYLKKSPIYRKKSHPKGAAKPHPWRRASDATPPAGMQHPGFRAHPPAAGGAGAKAEHITPTAPPKKKTRKKQGEGAMGAKAEFVIKILKKRL